MSTGLAAASAAILALPTTGWRSTMTSAYCSSVRMVAGRLSPFDTLENCTPCVIGMTLPPRRCMAAMKLALVRVLGS